MPRLAALFYRVDGVEDIDRLVFVVADRPALRGATEVNLGLDAIGGRRGSARTGYGDGMRSRSAVNLVSVLVCSLAGSLVGRVVAQASELRGELVRYSEDLASLKRKYPLRLSGRRMARLVAFQKGVLARLGEIEVGELSRAGQVDYRVLTTEVRRRLAHLRDDAGRNGKVRGLLPFVAPMVELLEAREDMAPVVAETVADEVQGWVGVVEAAVPKVRAAALDPSEALYAARRLGELRSSFGRWFRFRDGYDPQFGWWLKRPVAALQAALGRCQGVLDRARGGGASAGSSAEGAPVIGVPIGREALVRELGFEWIPYSPEELIAIAEREFAWCDAEMARAAVALGFPADGWRAAQEQVKGLHVAPGEQPALILKLAKEAEAFLAKHELVTVPALCSETWRMEMMSPSRQLVNPYFTGGEVISVSFPTDGMEHAAKKMSLRGNNIHFARATVHHELIPGHHLQRFMQKRYRSYRMPFGTPFWLEGWALYWEMLLWDRGFPQSPEDRIGMLFWRKHRCARIVFSLSYHLGEWSEQQCIDYLVERVGHEPRNATAEVRRSVIGGYEPLYQAAYMLGGLQLRALSREVVGQGQMTERAFHDAILRENSMPIELLRAILTDSAVPSRAQWRGL